MENLATAIHTSVSAVCPIVGVSIGSPADKTTWRIEYALSATQNQKTAAQTAISAFDVAAEIAREDAQQTADTADAGAARTLPKIQALRGMTPAQAQAWVAANVNTFADQKDLSGTILAILCVLARRL